MMVEPLFRAINSGSCRRGIAELFHYSFISRCEIEKISKDLHSPEQN
jgi:hypothetical protein